MHYCCNDDDAPSTVSKWVLSSRNRNAMLRRISISIDDMVFRAHKYTWGTIKSLRGCKLTTWDLYEEVRLGVCGLTPFSYDMVETQIEFVVG
jgi:hypothetical protein